MISSSVIPFSFCLQFPRTRGISNESVHPIRWPLYWSFRFTISPSNEYSGLIYFRIDWFDLAVQGTLKSIQHHSSKASIFLCASFFMVQLSHLYMSTGRNIALTRQTFVRKAMSLILSMLSRLSRLVPNQEKRMPRLCTVTLLI